MTLSPEHRIAGLLAPLFAIRSENDLGIGDTESLGQLVDWAAGIGFRLVQLLPINETGNDNSPYNAISSVAIDPTTIAIAPGTIPGLTPEDWARVTGQFDLSGLRTGPVQYQQVKTLKRALLEAAFANFRVVALRRNTSSARAFRTFARDNAAWLDGYALFRTLMDENGNTETWDRWPAEQQNARAARAWLEAQPAAHRKGFELTVTYFKWVQWIAFSQWTALKSRCDAKGVALMGDVPFGVSYYSADVFIHPHIFDLQWFGGAPPERVFKSDPFTEKWGQNWGVPLYKWDVLRTENWSWWRQRVHMVREIFHLFRIDHVLGFYRIYSFPWRPERNVEFLPLSEEEAHSRTGGALPRFMLHDDETPENREANRRQGEELLRVLLEEVGEHRLIGEDLGVVPPYVRPNLTALGIPGFKIPMWEDDGQGYLLDGRTYERLSVAAYGTHDHPPMKAFWEEWKSAMEQGNEEAAMARREMEKLARFAGIDSPLPVPFDDATHEAFMHALFGSNAWLAIVMITDLFASRQRFNIPGAVSDRNWSERLQHTVRELAVDPMLGPRMARMAEIIKATERVPRD